MNLFHFKKKNTSKAKLLNYREITGVNKKSIYDYQCIRKKNLGSREQEYQKIRELDGLQDLPAGIKNIIMWVVVEACHLPRWCSGKISTCQCRRCGVQFLGQEDALEKEMATHPSILAWEIPWTQEPGELPSMVSATV